MVVNILRQLGSLLLATLLYINGGLALVTEVEVQLIGPSWATRGGSVGLRCLHEVASHLLYKVEFMRSGSGGAKLMQYVRERIPPFTAYTFSGGTLNMSLSTPNSITIDNLETTATGLYWCEVSLETPIFTAASPPHQLTVIYPQKHPPIITFGDPDVVMGGLLRANCTSAPASPAPKLTWFIDDVAVAAESVRHFSYRVSSSTRSKGGGVHRHRKHQHRYLAPELNHTSRYRALISETTSSPSGNRHGKCTLNNGYIEEISKQLRDKPRPTVSPVQLWVSVLELRAPAYGRLQLTCMATIPDKIAAGEQYADIKKQTVAVAVNEVSLKKPISDATISKSQASGLHMNNTMFTYILINLYIFCNMSVYFY